MTLMYEGPDPSYTVIWVSLTTLNQKKTREFYNANLYLKFHHKTFAKYHRSRCKDSRSKFQGSIADLDPLSLILQWFKISYSDSFCTISNAYLLLEWFQILSHLIWVSDRIVVWFNSISLFFFYGFIWQLFYLHDFLLSPSIRFDQPTVSHLLSKISWGFFSN